MLCGQSEWNGTVHHMSNFATHPLPSYKKQKDLEANTQ